MAKSRPTKSEDSPANVAADSAALAAPAPDSRPAVRLRLARPHRLIQATQSPSEGRDRYGRTVPNRRGVDIRVSKALFKPSLVVMDRFIKALESQDLRVELTSGYQDAGTFVCSGRDRVSINLHEGSKRVEHIPTSSDLRDKQTFGSRIPKWDDLPNGELFLSPGGAIDLSSDRAIGQLIAKAVADVVQQLAEARERRKKEESRQRREAERQMRAHEEKQRIAALHKAAESLHQYRTMTAYIEEVRRFGRIPADQRRDGQSLEDWLVWAEHQAQQIHPLGD